MFKINPIDKVVGEFEPSPDKSITHRALFLSSLAQGVSTIKNPSLCKDCLSTINAMKKLDVKFHVAEDKKEVKVFSSGKHSLKEPDDVINCENSGTTMRLLSGIIAGRGIFSVLTGDYQLRRRPMDRIITPLSKMGANLYARCNNKFPPLVILKNNEKLKGIEYTLPQASAQVKSCILLASLFAKETTKTYITEPLPTRDHTELMLSEFGVDITKQDNKILIDCGKDLKPTVINIPGDISAASFFIVAGLILENSHILIKNVNLNPTRTGILEALSMLGGSISINIKKKINKEGFFGKEPVGDIEVRSSKLTGITLPEEIVPRMIDEIPIFTVACVFAKGKTIITGAKELRYKESDRIKAMATELSKLGADITQTEDGFIIEGIKKERLKGGIHLSSYDDHRVAMSLIIASLKSQKENYLDNINCIEISDPNFMQILNKLCK